MDLDEENPLPLTAEAAENETDITTSPVKKTKLDGAQLSSHCTPAPPSHASPRKDDLEVEFVQCDESEFLDGAIRLANLQAGT